MHLEREVFEDLVAGREAGYGEHISCRSSRAPASAAQEQGPACIGSTGASAAQEQRRGTAGIRQRRVTYANETFLNSIKGGSLKAAFDVLTSDGRASGKALGLLCQGRRRTTDAAAGVKGQIGGWMRAA